LRASNSLSTTLDQISVYL